MDNERPLPSDTELRLKAIIDTAVDGIITINDRGVIDTINPAVTRLFGYEEKELVGQNVQILMPEPDRSNHDGYLDKYHKTGKANIIGKGREVIGRRKDGSLFPFLLSISRVKLSNKQMFTGIIHDISELWEVKEALKKEMQLNELKSRFVTMASHEFRTPLSAILSSASLIGKYNDTGDDEKRFKHINRIKASVSNMTNILNDFLSISRLEEGMVMTNAVEVKMEDIAGEVMEQINPVLKDRQHIEYTHTGGTTPLMMDPNILKNILINMLSNACKYSAENKEIGFHTEQTGDTLSIKISDNGIGIPDADKPLLFGRFFRAQNATNVQGTGLGLNIVKKYLDLIDGKIEFTSELNVGTTFYITIPINKKSVY